MKNFLKKYYRDIILIFSLLILVIPFVVIFNFINQSSNNLSAYIYCENNLIETIDLSHENEERYFTIQGKNSEMVIGVKHNSICVKESGCPHHDCMEMGWVSNYYTPIICTYNMVKICFNSDSDVVIG